MSKHGQTFEGEGLVEDSVIAELIRDPGTDRTRFALCRDGEVTFVDEVKLASGDMLRPIAARNNLLRHNVVRLPDGLGDYASLATLRADLASFIERHVVLPERFLPIAVHCPSSEHLAQLAA